MTIGPWDFNGFDIAVLVLCAISFFMAMSRGFTREITAIIALVVGTLATLFVWGQFRPVAHGFISPEWLADGVLGVGTFFAAYLLVGFFLNNMTGKRKGEVSLGNRLLGGAFGAARGLVIAALLTMVVNSGYYDKLKANRPDADLAPFLEESILYDNALVPIMGAIRSIPFTNIKETLKKLADGDTEGFIEGITDEIIDENE
ncbi:MAG: CvpA family protein [Hellea sp.]|nr:CvpA family protein [Hellea sp.]